MSKIHFFDDSILLNGHKVRNEVLIIMKFTSFAIKQSADKEISPHFGSVNC